MIDTKKKVKQGVVAFADQVVVSSSTFMTMLLVARNSSEFDVGVFALAWTTISFLRTVQERIIAAPFLAFTYQPDFQRPTFRGSSIAHQIGFAIVASALVFLGSFVFWILKGDSRGLLFGLSIAVTLPFHLIRDQMRAISCADFAYSRLLVLDVAIVSCQMLGLLVLSWLGIFQLPAANLVLGFACVAPIVFWLVVIRKSYSFEIGFVKSDWKHNWRYSRWLVVARVLGIAPILIIPWLIAFILSERDAGVFAVCASLVGVSLMFVTGANNMFLPRTVHELHHRGMRSMLISVGEAMTVIFTVLTCVSIVFWFFGGTLLSIYDDEEMVGISPVEAYRYKDFGVLAFLLSVSTLAVSVSTIFGNGLTALRKARDFFWGEVSCCVVSIVAAVLLIPICGLNGAAFSQILGGLTATVVTGLTLFRGVRAYSGHSCLTISTVRSIADEARGF